MSGSPAWLQAWFAGRERGCRDRGVAIELSVRAADRGPVRRGRKNPPDAGVTMDSGTRWGRVSVFAASGAGVIAIDLVGDAAWQGHVDPQSPADLDRALDQVLAWVEATGETPGWATF
ncbi:hypothetical protein ACIPW5_29860 [Streptomyces sp. NPDC090077]|uniref:hypothetical protein n=1 Tax=Streptomyces sp. NPDC090077 TaxID=3365938 RepID=UPI0038051CD4